MPGGSVFDPTDRGSTAVSHPRYIDTLVLTVMVVA